MSKPMAHWRNGVLTRKQKLFIINIEAKIDVTYNGKTIADATKFISENIDDYNNVMFDEANDDILTDIYRYGN